MVKINSISIPSKRKSLFIYRLEHSKTGNGPYQTGWKYDTDRHYDENHPVPHRDKGISDFIKKKNLKECKFPENVFCGFHTLDQLISWFNTKELLTLMFRGFVIKVYSSKRYIIGEKQVIFVKEESREVPIDHVIAFDKIDKLITV